MAGNASLSAARDAKQDEFYTQLDDIAKELKFYKLHFKGKVVFCNCDDPYESNFFKYFALNFNSLGLKKLIATCYNGSPIAGDELPLLFELPIVDNASKRCNSSERLETFATPKKIAYKVEITEVKDYNGDGAVNLADVQYLIQNDKNVLSLLKGNGDFRSQECIELLKEADIVVTNPPFSLFREYIAQLMEYEKSFLVIGNQNAITYKEIFQYMRENKVWLGYKGGDMGFRVPSYFEPRATRYWVDETGQKWRSMGNICWFTNLDIQKRHEELILYKHYNTEEYPKYDNYDAINVNKVSDIPIDYDGVMGVPITFMDKYNPDQFEILNCNDYRVNDRVPVKSHGLIKDKEGAINGKPTYARILIRRKR